MHHRSWRLAAGLGGLVLLAVVPYLGALDYPLMRDDRTLLGSEWLVEEADVAEVWRHDYWHGTRVAGSDLYRPVTVLALVWNARWDATPRGFRSVQCGLHAAMTLLVLAGLAAVGRTLGPEGSGAGATPWIGAALFAVHPLASESVLFAVGRADILAAGLGLAAFLLLLPRRAPATGTPASPRPDTPGVPGTRHPDRGSMRRAAAVVGSSILLFLALCSKESAAAWPLILLAWAMAARLAGRPARIAPGLCGWMTALAAFIALRGSVVGFAPRVPPWVDNPLVLHDTATQIANAVLLLGRYAAKMVLPRTLSVEYGFDQIAVRPLAVALPAAVALGVAWIAVAAWLARRRHAGPFFLWCFVPAAFAVTANVALPIGVIFAERLAYLPLAGACGLAGMLLARIPRTPVALGLAAVLVVTAAVRTERRAGDFRDYVTHVETTAAASPRAVKALSNVGRTRLRMGRPDLAAEPLERAVEIWPEYVRALWLLGDCREQLGDPEGAAALRKRATRARAAAAGPESIPTDD